VGRLRVLGTRRKRSQVSPKNSPQKPSQPNRSDARAAIKDGVFPAYVAYWEALGYSRNKIIQGSEIGRGTFYRHVNSEVRTHELQL
jgi:hypothetical protein